MAKEKKRVLAVIVFVTMIVSSADAQRGFNNHYRNRMSHDYAMTYRAPYGAANRHVYNYYNYSRPVIINRAPLAFGPRYYGLPYGSVSITFGGNPYFYSGGCFYTPFGGYYRTIFPPVGIRVAILPRGYLSIYAGPDPFYFYNGIFYRRYDDRSYEVVDAPMGAQLSSLPNGARSVVVNGEKFYELNGTYFKEDRNFKGQIVYTVVGKNGQIDNSETSPTPAPPAPPKTGDRVTELPDNCKTIVINGEKLYVSPTDTYYRPETDGTYTIVGTATDQAS